MLGRTEVPQVIADLRALNASTESGFLDIGGRLTGFLGAARLVRRDIEELAGFIGGSACGRVLAGLEGVLAQTNAMRESLGDAERALAALRRNASDVQEAFLGFRAGVYSFRVVSTLGRIETARLEDSHKSAQAELSVVRDGNNLTQFAAALATGTERIDRSVRRALDAAAALFARVNGAITRLSGLDTEQIRRLPELVHAVQDSVAAVHHREQQARTASANLDGEFSSLCGAVDSLVTELQFHDITRQQIEHVVENLEHVAGPLSDESAAVIELQRRQLASAAAAFTRSAAHIKEELGHIAGLAARMDAEAAALHTFAGGQQSSIFRQTGDVLDALSAGAAISIQTGGLTAGLAKYTAGLDECVADIREISTVIRYLGINAAISAFRLGAAGVPLGIVAEAMRSLHRDVERRAAGAGKCVADLTASLSMAAGGRSRDDTAGAALRESVHAMRAAADSAGSFSAKIGAAVAALSGGVQSAADGFTVGALVESTLDRCCQALERIVLESGISAASADAVRRLADRYTMHSEREVHAGMDASIPASAALPPPQPGDFGENVELF